MFKYRPISRKFSLGLVKCLVLVLVLIFMRNWACSFHDWSSLTVQKFDFVPRDVDIDVAWWLKQQLQTAGFKKVVMAKTEGVDSKLIAKVLKWASFEVRFSQMPWRPSAPLEISSDEVAVFIKSVEYFVTDEFYKDKANPGVYSVIAKSSKTVRLKVLLKDGRIALIDEIYPYHEVNLVLQQEDAKEWWKLLEMEDNWGYFPDWSWYSHDYVEMGATCPTTSTQEVDRPVFKY